MESSNKQIPEKKKKIKVYKSQFMACILNGYILLLMCQHY